MGRKSNEKKQRREARENSKFVELPNWPDTPEGKQEFEEKLNIFRGLAKEAMEKGEEDTAEKMYKLIERIDKIDDEVFAINPYYHVEPMKSGEGGVLVLHFDTEVCSSKKALMRLAQFADFTDEKHTEEEILQECRKIVDEIEWNWYAIDDDENTVALTVLAKGEDLEDIADTRTVKAGMPDDIEDTLSYEIAILLMAANKVNVADGGKDEFRIFDDPRDIAHINEIAQRKLKELKK